ncbi:MAG: LysR family transcriptional regulator [Nannocystales bacterium]
MAKLDPSQLVALHALLEECHVTAAARRLGVTQSTMSHRLRQLRDELGDPLLVRQGRALVRTARAQTLLGPLGEALDALEKAVADPEPFDPARAEVEVPIAVPDLLAPVLPRIIGVLQHESPQLKLRIIPIPRDIPEALATDSRWLVLAPSHLSNDTTRSRGLGELRFGAVARTGHPAFRSTLTLKRWLAYPHVVVSVGNRSTNLVDQALEERGRSRNIGLTVPNFLAGLIAVATSDLLMNAPMPLGREVTELLGVRTRKLPIPVEPVRLSVLWHERRHQEPAHVWLRGRLYELVRAWLRPSTD